MDDEQIPGGSGVKPLDNVAVSSTITSTNGVPIIVERAMWWPSPALTARLLDRGAQLARARPRPATRWALAEGEVGGPQSAETYILIANTSAYGRQRARDALLRGRHDGGTDLRAARRAAAPTSASRSSSPAAAGRRFGAVVESLGATPAQIVVERAMYTSPGGVTWAAGTNALATPLP